MANSKIGTFRLMDLKDWWEGLPEGDKGSYVRQAIRSYLQGGPRSVSNFEMTSISNVQLQKTEKELDINDLESKLDNFDF